MERSKVQGSRDKQSNRIRQRFQNKNLYIGMYEPGLKKEENKIWWEQRKTIE
jgi:hypothetical protein